MVACLFFGIASVVALHTDLLFPQTYSDAVDGARAALRVARELGHQRIKLELPVLPPGCSLEDDLRPGQGANAWPGGAAQSHRSGVQPLASELLSGYDANFLGMIDVGMGVWSLKGGDITCISNVADLSFDSFARLCDGDFGAAPTRSNHTLLLLNPRLSCSANIGQPWQPAVRRKAKALVDDAGWLWAYRCRTIAARGGVSSDGVVVCSELEGLCGSAVFAMPRGERVAASDELYAFYGADDNLREARRVVREHQEQQPEEQARS